MPWALLGEQEANVKATAVATQAVGMARVRPDTCCQENFPFLPPIKHCSQSTQGSPAPWAGPLLAQGFRMPQLARATSLSLSLWSLQEMEREEEELECKRG